MIQVKLLLPVSGKTSESFSVLDLMRLPLGILTGMGFIGAGAIVKRGSLVHGLTTAATLWFATVLGLCFGDGYDLPDPFQSGVRDVCQRRAARECHSQVKFRQNVLDQLTNTVLTGNGQTVDVGTPETDR
jgi:hypothetical protein